MALKNFRSLLTEGYLYLGVAFNDVDETTTVPLSLGKIFMNDSIQECGASFGYKWKYREGVLPFWHKVQYSNLFLYGVSPSGVPISGALNDPNFLMFNSPPSNYLINYPSYSGIAFVGTSGATTYSGVSTSGTVINSIYTGTGFRYDMPAEVEHIEGVYIQNTGFLVNGMKQRMDMAYQGAYIATSGTPGMYLEYPGLNPSGNLALIFNPNVATSLSGTNFNFLYEKKQQPLVDLSDTQDIIPSEFQNVIIEAWLEKAYAFRQNNEQMIYHKQKKDGYLFDMARNSERYTNYTVAWFSDGQLGYVGALPYTNGGMATWNWI